MLQDFIVTNREKIVERARRRVSERGSPKSSDPHSEHALPILLTQIVGALAEARTLRVAGTTLPNTEIRDTAALHGRDSLRNGLTVLQMVGGYSDVRQVVTELASAAAVAISAQDYHLVGN